MDSKEADKLITEWAESRDIPIKPNKLQNIVWLLEDYTMQIADDKKLTKVELYEYLDDMKEKIEEILDNDDEDTIIRS
jgi:CRISPR/Cas system CSM-associated protein Csm2 small subunit